MCLVDIESYIYALTFCRYSQYVIVPNPRYLIKVPDAVAMDTAALLPCSGVTAFNALRHVLPIVTESLNMFGKY